jgi:hypothetical protein
MTKGPQIDFDKTLARQLRKGGATWAMIAKQCGVSTEVVQRAIDPGYAERRSADIRAARQLRRGSLHVEPSSVRMSPADKLEAERMLAELPPDTRGLTARICGDPIPGRSALDRKAGR